MCLDEGVSFTTQLSHLNLLRRDAVFVFAVLPSGSGDPLSSLCFLLVPLPLRGNTALLTGCLFASPDACMEISMLGRGWGCQGEN